VVVHELRYYHATYREARGHRFTDELLVDEDGQWFINYLHDRFAGGSFAEPDYSALRDHRDLISRRLRQFASDPHVFAKYLWVARYHNFFCDRYAPDQTLLLDVLPLKATQIEDSYDRA
jgi:hypothetical protein